MVDLKLNNCLLCVLVLISCTMFIWTINYVSATDSNHIQTAITAFNA